MARWSGTGRVLAYLLAGTAVTVGTSGDAWAEFPGEVWSVSYVKVGGSSGSGMINAINLGLTKASNVYFYGDKATRIDANVSGTGIMDLRMVDLASGNTVAEARGLPFAESGDVAQSVTSSALAWMESLNCAEGCSLAVSGAAPKPVQIAQAPAPSPAPVPEAPKPVEVVEAPAPQPVLPVKTEPEPQPVKQKDKPELDLALDEPRPQTPKPARPVSQAELRNPSAESIVQGLDADQVLAAIEKPTPAKPRVTTRKSPEVAAVSNAPSLVALPTPKVTTPEIVAPQQPGTGAAAVAAAATTAGGAPEISLALPVPEVETPAIPEIAETPELAAVAPDAEAAVPAVPVIEEPEATTPTIVAPTTTEPVSPTVPETPGVPETPAIAVREPEPEVEPQQQEQPEPPFEVATAPVPEEITPQLPSVVENEVPILVNPAPAGGLAVPDQQLVPANPQVPALPVPETPQEPTAPLVSDAPDEGETAQVETQLAAINPAEAGPTLANARWIGFTPAVFTGADTRSGAWIAGPFDRKQRTGWITDTATGATTRVTFYWRDASSGGRTATLSNEAAKALGIGQGDVANVAVYLPR
ncbi:MAG: hypothetical protein AB8B85_05260 [Paracoccaceae bacterium]